MRPLAAQGFLDNENLDQLPENLEIFVTVGINFDLTWKLLLKFYQQKKLTGPFFWRDRGCGWEFDFCFMDYLGTILANLGFVSLHGWQFHIARCRSGIIRAVLTSYRRCFSSSLGGKPVANNLDVLESTSYTWGKFPRKLQP